MLSHWFVTDDLRLTLCMPYHHAAWLVGLSYLVAAVASFAAFQVIDRIRDASGFGVRRIWLATAGLTMGLGIWAMHFIAMLALEIPIQIHFELPLTVLSAGFAIAASTAAFTIITGKGHAWARLAVAGTTLGAGVGLMHYVGMASLRIAARIHYEPVLFALSIAVAVVLSTGALFTLSVVPPSKRGFPTLRLAGAAVMGLAIALMHYTGMFATSFYPEPDLLDSGILFDPTVMSAVIALVSLMLVGCAMAAAWFDYRIDRAQRLLHDAIESFSEGFVIYDEVGQLVLCNQAYRENYAGDAGPLIPSGEPASVQTGSFERQLDNGSWVLVTDRKMTNGGTAGLRINISALKSAQLALRTSKQQLDIALNNLSQGVCFFDGARRLILANRRYAEIYGIPSRAIEPGTTLEEIVDYRIEAGTFPNIGREAYFRWRDGLAVSEPSDSVLELKSGQTVAIHHRPLPDGGWVSTHEDITERRRAERSLAHMARHDALTGLPNRVVFREYLNKDLTRSERGQSIAVLCLDLDRFKYVNDTFGHAAGDALLCAVAERISNNVRSEDIVIRLGGDEFAIVQIGVEQPVHAMALADRLIEILSQPYQLGRDWATVGASVGIAYHLDREVDAEILLKNADMALYRAKANGRGTFCFFDPIMDQEAHERHDLEAGLRAAIANDEFELAFQPVLNVHTEELTRFEALLRWRHPRRGLISPSQFVPLAEEIGLIVPIGEWVLREACRIAAEWPSHISVAVNLSPAQLKSATLLSTVREALDMAHLAADRLELEITETVLLENSAPVLDALRQLRELGLRIALDDFGTGFSSISCLRSFPFDKIKIDQSFVRELDRRPDSIAIVHAIVDLACALGMSVTAEGVETMEQLTLLRAESCAEVQGHLFSAPVPAEQIPALLARLDPSSRVAALTY